MYQFSSSDYTAKLRQQTSVCGCGYTGPTGPSGDTAIVANYVNSSPSFTWTNTTGNGVPLASNQLGFQTNLPTLNATGGPLTSGNNSNVDSFTLPSAGTYFFNYIILFNDSGTILPLVSPVRVQLFQLNPPPYKLIFDGTTFVFNQYSAFSASGIVQCSNDVASATITTFITTNNATTQVVQTQCTVTRLN
jgi:hypothetical protein